MSTSNLLLRTTRVLASQQASLSRSAVVFSDIQVKDKLKITKQIEVGFSKQTLLHCLFEQTDISASKVPGLITVEGAPDVALTSGMPDEERKSRVVRIYKPAKNAMQSGTAGIKRCANFIQNHDSKFNVGGRSSLTINSDGKTT